MKKKPWIIEFIIEFSEKDGKINGEPYASLAIFKYIGKYGKHMKIKKATQCHTKVICWIKAKNRLFLNINKNSPNTISTTAKYRKVKWWDPISRFNDSNSSKIDFLDVFSSNSRRKKVVDRRKNIPRNWGYAPQLNISKWNSLNIRRRVTINAA